MDLSLFGVPVFQGFGAYQLAALGVVFFGSYFLKGAFGFGSLTPAILFASWIIEPHHAILLALISNAASQIQFIPEGLRNGSWSIVRTVIVANLVGAVIGIAIFSKLDGGGLTLTLGLSLGLLVLSDMARLPEKLGKVVDVRSRVVGWAVAGFSGLISGITGAGGLFFMAYFIKLALPDPRAFRATTLLVSAIVVLWRTSILVATGFVDLTLMLEVMCLAPFYVAGGWVGSWFFGKLSPKSFFTGIQLLLLIASIGLVVKGWEG